MHQGTYGSCLESDVKTVDTALRVSDVVLQTLLSLRAVSRTPCKPIDLRLGRLGVRGKPVCAAFLLTGSLSSIDSADGSAPPLFIDVTGTMDPSDFLMSFMSAVRSMTLTDHVDDCHLSSYWPNAFRCDFVSTSLTSSVN